MENRTPMKDALSRTNETEETARSNTGCADSSNNKSLLELLCQQVPYKKANETTKPTPGQSPLERSENPKKPEVTSCTVTSGGASIYISVPLKKTTLSTSSSRENISGLSEEVPVTTTNEFLPLTLTETIDSENQSTATTCTSVSPSAPQKEITVSTSSSRKNISGLIEEIPLSPTNAFLPPTHTKTINTETAYSDISEDTQLPGTLETVSIEHNTRYSIADDSFKYLKSTSEIEKKTNLDVSPTSARENKSISEIKNSLTTTINLICEAVLQLENEYTPPKGFDEPSCSKTNPDESDQAFPSRYFRSDKDEFRIKEFDAFESESDRTRVIQGFGETAPGRHDTPERSGRVYERLRVQNWLDKMPSKQSLDSKTKISSDNADLSFKVPKKPKRLSVGDYNKASTSKMEPSLYLPGVTENFKADSPATREKIVLKKVSRLESMLDLFNDRVDDATFKTSIMMLFMDIITSEFRYHLSLEDTFKVLRILSCNLCAKKYETAKGMKSATIEAIKSLDKIPSGLWIEHLMIIIKCLPDSSYYQDVILQLLKVFLFTGGRELEDIHLINLLLAFNDLYETKIGAELKDKVLWCIATVHKKVGETKFQDFLDFVPRGVMPHVRTYSSSLEI